jgi:hypothetical protein
MDYEQVQFVDAIVRQAHHALGNMLITTGMALQRFGALSPELQVLFFAQWKNLHLKAMQDLQTSFGALNAHDGIQ